MKTSRINMLQHSLIAGAIALGISACGGAEKSDQAAKQTDTTSHPGVYIPPQTPHYDGTPYWLVQSKNWPAFQEWAIGPDGEYVHDSLRIRLTGNVIQSFVSGPKSKDHPIMCWFELTARPVPRRLVGYALNIDSVVFYDPVKKITLPALPMLSSERHTESGVVRTRFTNNLARMHTPDLVENQFLEPHIYIGGVDKKQIKVSLQPIPVTFLREVAPTEVPTDSLKWGPS
jgi:hypothetical protein